MNYEVVRDTFRVPRQSRVDSITVAGFWYREACAWEETTVLVGFSNGTEQNQRTRVINCVLDLW